MAWAAVKAALQTNNSRSFPKSHRCAFSSPASSSSPSGRATPKYKNSSPGHSQLSPSAKHSTIPHQTFASPAAGAPCWAGEGNRDTEVHSSHPPEPAPTNLPQQEDVCTQLGPRELKSRPAWEVGEAKGLGCILKTHPKPPHITSFPTILFTQLVMVCRSFPWTTKVRSDWVSFPHFPPLSLQPAQGGLVGLCQAGGILRDTTQGVILLTGKPSAPGPAICTYSSRPCYSHNPSLHTVEYSSGKSSLVKLVMHPALYKVGFSQPANKCRGKKLATVPRPGTEISHCC